MPNLLHGVTVIVKLEGVDSEIGVDEDLSGLYYEEE